MENELLDLCRLNLLEDHIMLQRGEGIKTPIDKESNDTLNAILWKKQQIIKKIESSKILLDDWDETNL